MYNIDHPGAPVLRDDEDRRRKDRRPVIRYGARDRSGSAKFTRGERQLIEPDRTGTKRYLLGTIEDGDRATEPLATRSSLVKLLSVSAWEDADILVEGPSVNQDLRAVLAHCATSLSHRELHIIDLRDVTSHRRSAKRRYDSWTEHMDPYDRSRTVRSLAEGIAELTLELHSAGIKDKTLHVLGLEGQPARDAARAETAAAHLRAQRWNDREIRDYLALNGFVNYSGNVGIWTHDQYTKIAGLR